MDSETRKLIVFIVSGLFGLGYSVFAWLEAGFSVISLLAFLATIGVVLFLLGNLMVFLEPFLGDRLEDRFETDMSPDKYTPWKNYEE